MKFSKSNRRLKIRRRIRKNIKGTAARPRLSVFRSNKEIYCQLVDDVNGLTLAAASSREGSIGREGNKVDQASQVGKLIAERAKAASVDVAVFDRAGYLYHGRVKALADGAREGGLKL
ncbi:MAG: 50S ribosomal protein L18 [Bacteroidota bacterium]